MNYAKSFSVIVVAALAVCACATAPKVRIDKDASVSLSSYKTFAWLAPQQQPIKEESKPVSGKDAAPPAPEVNSLMESRVRAAVTAVMQAKGYAANDAMPDFRVSYVLNVYDRPKQGGVRIGVGAGGSSGHVGGGVGLSIPVGKRTETMAAMTIDIIDVTRNAQVWTGSYEQRIKGPTLTDADAQALSSIILEKYPARAGVQ